MSLPTSRNRTYAAGSQVFSLDLNNLQDAIISLHAGTIGVSAAAARERTAQGGSAWVVGEVGQSNLASSTGNDLIIPLPFIPTGRVIDALRIVVNHSVATAGSLVAQFSRVVYSAGSPGSVTATNIGSSVGSAATTGIQVITISPAHTVLVENAYQVKLSVAGSSMDRSFYGMHVDWHSTL